MFTSSLDHLFAWFWCQEDRGQSSSGSDQYAQCIFLYNIWKPRTDSPLVLWKTLLILQSIISWRPLNKQLVGLSTLTCNSPYLWTISLSFLHSHFFFTQTQRIGRYHVHSHSLAIYQPWNCCGSHNCFHNIIQIRSDQLICISNISISINCVFIKYEIT